VSDRRSFVASHLQLASAAKGAAQLQNVVRAIRGEKQHKTRSETGDYEDECNEYAAAQPDQSTTRAAALQSGETRSHQRHHEFDYDVGIAR
jgi:hypothetical protein